MLSTLEDLGMVEQIEPGGNYRVGVGHDRDRRRGAARAHADRRGATTSAFLVKATGEAAGLSIADGFDMLYLDQVDADNQVQVRDWTGERVPAHTVSSGQVLLAFGAIDADSYLAQPLERTASGTLTDADAIRTRFAEIAAKGYAWAFEEFLDGLNSVAAPIRDPAAASSARSTRTGPRIASRATSTPTRLAAWLPPPPSECSYDRMLRLRDRRWWIGRLGAGQPSQRRSRPPACSCSRPAAPTTSGTSSSTCRPR